VYRLVTRLSSIQRRASVAHRNASFSLLVCLDVVVFVSWWFLSVIRLYPG
jgi:hypothetical protein